MPTRLSCLALLLGLCTALACAPPKLPGTTGQDGDGDGDRETSFCDFGAQPDEPCVDLPGASCRPFFEEEVPGFTELGACLLPGGG